MFRSLLLPLIALGNIIAQEDSANCICGAQAPGDVVMGLIWPFHSEVSGIHDRVRPEHYTCSS